MSICFAGAVIHDVRRVPGGYSRRNSALFNQVEWRITVKAGDGLSDTITLKTARNPSPIVWPDPPTDKKQCPHCGYIEDDCSNGDCTCPDCLHYQPETDKHGTDLSGD